MPFDMSLLRLLTPNTSYLIPLQQPALHEESVASRTIRIDVDGSAMRIEA